MQKLKSLIGLIGGITKLPPRIKLLIAAMFVLIMVPLALQYRHNQLYTVSLSSRQLLSKASIDTSKVKVTAKSVSYNMADQKPTGDKDVTIAGPTDATGKTGYQATINTDFKQGLSFGDSSSELSFKMTPLFNASKAQYQNGQVLFPVSSSTKIFQTFKKNGIKEDIVLTKAPAKTASWQWQLGLGDKLSAKLLPNGGIGIFSSSPFLFGNLTVSDAKSQKLVDTARKTDRTNLAFVIPTPYITDAKGLKNYEDVSFKLTGNTLTLEARNLTNKTYPLSVDPSVVVSTNSEFLTGSDDGTISYPGAGNISRSNISEGTVGGWANTTGFTTGRRGHTSVAYNGYLYVIGGYGNYSLDTVQKAAINADGTVGAWSTTTAFTTSRQDHTSVAYNGYLYVIGGWNGTTYYNDVQKAAIAADGTVGTWTATTSFITARYGHTSVAYNGYLYVIGGNMTGGAPYNNNVQKAAINADGTVGTWSATTAFTTARFDHTSIAYNGYLYVIGGFNGSYQNDVQKAAINADGTVGTWSTTTAFTTARYGHTSVAYNGYLYVIGGWSGVDQNDVQKAAINADGTVGAWSATAAFANQRTGHTSVAYNGYLYVIGGIYNSTVYLTSVQFSLVLAATGGAGAGGVGSTWSTTTAFTTVRNGHASVAYNGYLYVIGGSGSLNDVQKAAIASDGTVGAWSTTTAFTTGRTQHTSVAYNGYLYVIGGTNGTALNDVQKAAINADGTVGTWSTTTAFTTTRYLHTSVAYNGYLYVIGGLSGGGGNLNDVQKAAIASDGTVGVWTTTTAFTTARYSHTSVAYNGYLYVIGGNNGSYLNDVQKAAIASDGTVGAWTTTTAFTTVRAYHTSVAYNGYLYVIGGLNSGSYLNDVQKAAIASDGTVGVWTTTTAFTTARMLHASVAYNGYLYVIGGLASGSAYQNDVQYSLIQPGASGTFGAVGATTQQTAAFTGVRDYHTSVAYNGYLYIIGGTDSATTSFNDIQYCPINTDGSVGTCVVQTNAFTTGRMGHTSVVSNGYLYIIGGYNQGTTTYLNDIQHCPINTDGSVGTCVQQTNAFTTARTYHTSVVYKGYLYIIGGYNGTPLGDIQYCPINADGSVGTCVVQAAFVTARYRHTSVAYNGYLYLIGGAVSAAVQNDILHCPISAVDGSVGACVSQAAAFTTARYQHTSVAYNGYLYVIGGYNGATLNDIQHLPINADGSVGATVSQAAAFTTARFQHTSVAYDGYLYVIGGYNGTTYYNDIQYLSIQSPAQAAHYERVVDIGRAADTVDSIQYNGTAKCGAEVQYATAGNNGTFGALTTLMADAIPGTTYTLSGQTAKRYVRVVITLNDQSCGGTSSVTDLTVNYTLLPPDAPTVSAPASGAISISPAPQFQLKTTDAADNYAQYKILVYQSDCSTLIRTIDQTGSQTGWSGQDAQTSTAYVVGTTLGASTLASHTYQAAGLSYNTTYCWKAAAIDPGGSNTFGSYSATQLFTTNQTPAAPTLSQPASGQTGVSTTPELRLYSTDPDSDYIKYKIDICSTSNCSSVVRTIDQTSSQTGWSSQSLQSATAYSSGQTAIHTYQAAGLATNTQYWWRAYVIDPAGVNAFSAASSIGTFNTTPPTQTNVNIGGGTTIYGGTSIGQ